MWPSVNLRVYFSFKELINFKKVKKIMSYKFYSSLTTAFYFKAFCCIVQVKIDKKTRNERRSTTCRSTSGWNQTCGSAEVSVHEADALLSKLLRQGDIIHIIFTLSVGFLFCFVNCSSTGLFSWSHFLFFLWRLILFLTISCSVLHARWQCSLF